MPKIASTKELSTKRIKKEKILRLCFMIEFNIYHKITEDIELDCRDQIAIRNYVDTRPISTTKNDINKLESIQNHAEIDRIQNKRNKDASRLWFGDIEKHFKRGLLWKGLIVNLG